ncbi:MAG: HSP90 family protein [Ruminococcus sp.]|nr:HSP90 family protein [Ruminococcus sp.]
MEEYVFNVNLKGMLDILSNHLYSTPKVFIRELLQNSVDAINLRRSYESFEDPRIDIIIEENKSLTFRDNGSGLTEEEIHKFISVIGQSSKRDSRMSFIGRFGIGILSCFMVTPEITLRTRSYKTPDKVYEWHGFTDGKYTVSEISDDMKTGTEIYIKPSPSSESLFSFSDILGTVRYYGLPVQYPIYVTRGNFSARANPLFNKTSTSDRENVLSMGRHIFGTDFDFLDYIPLESESGLFSGVAYILPFTVSAASVRKHRIYLKNILLTEDGASILPEWAFFLKCFFNTDKLSATASREDFYRNELLDTAKKEISQCISSYLERISIQNPTLLARIVSLHGLALKSVAAENERLFKIFMPYFNFETSFGIRKGKMLMNYDYSIFYTTDSETFRQLKPVFCEKDELLVNCGLVYDKELISMLEKLNLAHTEAINTNLLNTMLEDPDETDDLFFLWLVATKALEQYDCSVCIKNFSPSQLSALYTTNSDGEISKEIEKTKQNSDEIFLNMLDSLGEELLYISPAMLYLNAGNSIITKLSHLDNPEKIQTFVRILYFNALITGGFPVSGSDLSIANEDLIKLIEWGL